MSKMAELYWEIELRVCEGMADGDIAQELDIPVSMVRDWYRNLNCNQESTGVTV